MAEVTMVMARAKEGMVAVEWDEAARAMVLMVVGRAEAMAVAAVAAALGEESAVDSANQRGILRPRKCPQLANKANPDPGVPCHPRLAK